MNIFVEFKARHLSGTVKGVLYECVPKIDLTENGELKVKIEENPHFFHVTKNGNGFIFESSDRNINFYHAIRNVIDLGYVPLCVQYENYYGDKYSFLVDESMEKPEISKELEKLFRKLK